MYWNECGLSCFNVVRLLLSEIADYGQLKHLPLVSLDHKQYPKDKKNDPCQDVDYKANHRYEDEDNIYNDDYHRQCDGLHGMETDKFVLGLQQKKYQTRDPTQQITQESSHIFLKTR
jgi:hypothetical protein